VCVGEGGRAWEMFYGKKEYYEVTSNEVLFKCNIFISARNVLSTLCNI
jgi:hypothetical protein